MKKMLSLVLAIILVLSCFVTASAEIAPVTTEEITLTYAAKNEEDELTKALAEQFMAKYPNIKVELIELDSDTWDTALQNLAAEQNLPDVFWVGSVTDAIANRWVLELSSFYADDPAAATISPGVLQFSQIGGKYYSIPAACKPTVAIVNKTLFEKYNVALPEYTWTLEDFYAVVEEVAHPENYDFGVASHTNFDEYLITHYDYDGTSYNFGDTWIEIWEKAIEWRVNKVSEMWDEGEKAAVLGDENASALHTGHVAVSLTAQEASFMQLAGFLNGDAEKQSGCEFLFYPLPQTELHSNNSTVDFAVLSSSCKYPREAWELAKWMTWGKEATILRTDYWNAKETRQFLDAPMIEDEDVWAYVIDNAQDKYKAFYENMEPVRPDIFPHAPNGLWMNVTWYFGGIIDKFAAGETTPADYAPTLRQEGANLYDTWAGWEILNGTTAE